MGNLAYCGTHEIPIEIRIPLIPRANDGEIPAIGALLAKNPAIDGVRVLPYHAYARSKYDALVMTYPGKNYTVPMRDMMARGGHAARLRAECFFACVGGLTDRFHFNVYKEK